MTSTLVWCTTMTLVVTGLHVYYWAVGQHDTATVKSNWIEAGASMESLPAHLSRSEFIDIKRKYTERENQRPKGNEVEI